MTGDGGKRGRRIVGQRVTALRNDTTRRRVIVHQPERKFQTKEAATQPDEIPRPADRDRHVAYRVLKNEIPTDDPRDDLTERCV